MELSKWCKGCKCAVCRWQGTDNCLKDTRPPCWQCDGRHSNVEHYIAVSWECRGFEKRQAMQIK